MPATLVSDYALGDSSTEKWTNLLNSIEKARKGFILLNLTNMSSTSEPKIEAGSYFEDNNSLYTFESDEDIGGTPTSDAINYIYFDPTTKTASWDDDPPIFSNDKGGWYNSGETKRCLGACYYDGANYYGKTVFDDVKSIKLEAGEGLSAGDLAEIFRNKVYKYALHSEEFEYDDAIPDSIDMVKIDETHIMIIYEDNGNSDYGTAIIGTIDGNDITFGNEYVFKSATTSHIAATLIDDNKVLIAYNASGGKAIVATVSGTTISFGSEASITTNSILYTSATKLDGNKALVSFSDYSDSWHGKSVVLTISGTTISVGSISTFSTHKTSYIGSVSIDTNIAVIAYSDSTDNDGKAVRASISGTTISFGTATSFDSSSASGATPQISKVISLSDFEVAIVYSVAAAPTKIKIVHGYVYHTTTYYLFFDSSVEVGSASSTYGTAVTSCHIGNRKVAIIYDTQSSTRTAIYHIPCGKPTQLFEMSNSTSFINNGRKACASIKVDKLVFAGRYSGGASAAQIINASKPVGLIPANISSGDNADIIIHGQWVVDGVYEDGDLGIDAEGNLTQSNTIINVGKITNNSRIIF